VDFSMQTLASAEAGAVSRTVAITFDDLPLTSHHGFSISTLTAITDRLVAVLQQYGVPATGFVNEGKLYIRGEIDRRVSLLEKWLDADLELGNHTFSHPSLNRVPIEDYEEDVVRGETVTKWLLRAHGREMRYFRHPFLDTGLTVETKRKFESFLLQRGMRVAPVTILSMEWNLGHAYAIAMLEHRTDDMQRAGAEYVAYMNDVFAHHEELAISTVGRELPQIIGLHANALNAYHFGALVEMIRRRGYSFVSVDSALEDPLYLLPDEYEGWAAVSWLLRWRVPSLDCS
jgi:peptidoglycan/xylan/chitin deacetylase (PgdA/CDA1 family)